MSLRPIRGAAVALAICAALAGCAHGSAPPAKPVPDSALTGLLLDGPDVNAVMGTTGMLSHPPATQMGDHRNLLPNLNCLGVWQVNEASVYESSHWKSVRQQMFRGPDTDAWDTLVVQSVVSYRTADGARGFFADSADRWSKCANHNINIRVNDEQLPAWKSGDLVTDGRLLVMPYTRGSGDMSRSCQHVISAAANVIVDVVACGAQSAGFDKAVRVVDKIEAKFPV